MAETTISHSGFTWKRLLVSSERTIERLPPPWTMGDTCTKTSCSIVESNTSNMCPCEEVYILKWTLLAMENRAALMKGAGLEAGAPSLMVV